jgi:hypothetical protein
MRIALAVLMTLHGIAHLVGFAGAWQLAAAANVPYKTTVLGGHVDLGGAGIRAVGILWVAAAVAFVAVSAGAVMHTDWWFRTAVLVALASLALTILELPEARIGAAVNVLLLAILLLAPVLRFA